MTTTNEPKQRPETGARGGAGYRGTLPAREDRLARPWLIIVGAIFVGILLLSVLGVPSRFVPDPTPVPLPTNPPATESPSASPTESESPTLEVSPSPSPSGS
ncbi:MAG: hypothetical protein KY392_02850 [Chloroflexi bacterium]|nr:hypothetical protein [Chloroflexota bacterium]